MEGRIEVSDAAARPVRGRRADGERADAQPRFRDRHARRLDGDGRRVRARQGGRCSARTNAAPAAAPTGSAAASAGNSRKGTLSSAPFRVTQPYASFLVSGGAFASTRVELVLRRRQHESSSRSPAPIRPRSAGGRRSEGVRRQGHLRSSRGRRDRRADRGLPEREPVGAHQLRRLPLSRHAAVLSERDRAVRDQHDAADGCRCRTRACLEPTRPRR